MPKDKKRREWGGDAMARDAEKILGYKPTKEEIRARNTRDKEATRSAAKDEDRQEALRGERTWPGQKFKRLAGGK